MIKRLLLSVSLMLFGLSCAAAEDGTNTYEAGTHYALISPPVRTLDSDTIEVAEFFLVRLQPLLFL
jgi:hypothetical protein